MESKTLAARQAVRAAMPVEGDLAFRRRCETVVEFLDAQPGDRILDCGCGYGFYLGLLRRLTGADVTGVDPDPERIAEVDARYGADSGIRVVRADGTALPFPDGTFSHALSSEVIEHVDDDAALVQELYRVLEAGGTAVLTVPARRYPAMWDPINFVLERTTGRHIGGERTFSGIWYGHKRLYEADELRAVAERAGFEIVEERSLTHRCPPFSHLILYGLLKPLFMSGKAPGWLTRGENRLVEAASTRASIPVRLAMRTLEWIDAANDDNAGKQRYVAHAVAARKPAGA